MPACRLPSKSYDGERGRIVDSKNPRESATENPTMPVDRKRKPRKPSRDEGPSDAEIKRFAEELRPLILRIEECKRILRHMPHPHKPRFVTTIERHGKRLDREIDRLLPNRDAHDDFYRDIFIGEGFRHADEVRLPSGERATLEQARTVLDCREKLRGRPLSRPAVKAVRREVVDRLYKALVWFGTEQTDNFRWALTRAHYRWHSYERLVSVFAISALFPARLKGVQS